MAKKRLKTLKMTTKTPLEHEIKVFTPAYGDFFKHYVLVKAKKPFYIHMEGKYGILAMKSSCSFSIFFRYLIYEGHKFDATRLQLQSYHLLLYKLLKKLNKKPGCSSVG